MGEGQTCGYAVRFTPRFEKAFKKKTAILRKAVEKTIGQLRLDPHYPSLRVKKVRGESSGKVWEASINMACRLTFEYEANEPTLIFRNCNGHSILTSP